MPGRPGDDLDDRFQHVVRVEQSHLRLAAAKQLDERLAEVLIDRFEGLFEALARSLVDLSNGLGESLDGGADVRPLLGEEDVSLRLLLVLLGGQEIDRSEPFHCLSAAVQVDLELVEVLRWGADFLGQALR